MLRTLNFAATEGEKVNLVLDTGELIQGATILRANELQVTFETRRNTSVISFDCINAIAVYINSNTYSEVQGILEDVFSDNPVLSDSYNDQFPVELVFRSGYSINTTILGEIQDDGTDFAFVGTENNDGNVAVVFNGANILRYNYNVTREGIPANPEEGGAEEPTLSTSFAQLEFNGSSSINYNVPSFTEVEYGNTGEGFKSDDSNFSISFSDTNKKKIKFEVDGTVQITATIRVDVEEPSLPNVLTQVQATLALDGNELIPDSDPTDQEPLIGFFPDITASIFVPQSGVAFPVTLTFNFITRVMRGHRLFLRLRRGLNSSTTSTINVQPTDTVITATYLDFTNSYIPSES